MCKKDYFFAVSTVLVVILPVVSSTGWKPIPPPANYYAAKAAAAAAASTTCGADCVKFPALDDGGIVGEGETQLKNTLTSQAPPQPVIPFNQEKDFHQNNPKLGLEVYKPVEVPFFQNEQPKSFGPPLQNFEEAQRKSPTTYFTFKAYGVPQKPSKTIYYGDVELAKPKFTDDFNFHKTYKTNLGDNVKVIKPFNFLENEIKSYRPLNQGNNQYEDHCSIYKVSFRQDLYYQYLQYKVHIPELKEFTLCLWMRLHNQSHDHSLFSYGVKNYKKAIYMWVNNLNEPGLFNLNIMGQTIYRLNYPIKLYSWYHTCQSWNGKTGEWQVWVNSHRIGRGFHNLLVGHFIPGGGIAISGQQNRHFSKGFQEIPHYFKGSGGLEGEITMLQLYKVALTAGKAYNDHRHHHSHYTTTTPEPPELPSEEPSTTSHPFLENGQLKKNINVLELAEALRNKGLKLPENPEMLNHGIPQTSYVSHIAPLAVPANAIQYVGIPSHSLFKRNDGNEAKTKKQTTVDDRSSQEDSKETPEKVKFISNVAGHIRVEKLKYDADQSSAETVSMPIVVKPESDTKKSNLTIDDYEYEYEYADDEKPANETTFNTGYRMARKRRHNVNIRVVPGRGRRISSTSSKPISFPSSRKDGGKETSKRHLLLVDPYIGLGNLGLMQHEIQPSYVGLPGSVSNLDHLGQFGPDFGVLPDGESLHDDDNPLNAPEQKDSRPQVELAENEVRRILSLCSGCDFDPYRKVAVIGWRSTPKKIFSGALFLKAKPECGNF